MRVPIFVPIFDYTVKMTYNGNVFSNRYINKLTIKFCLHKCFLRKIPFAHFSFKMSMTNPRNLCFPNPKSQSNFQIEVFGYAPIFRPKTQRISTRCPHIQNPTFYRTDIRSWIWNWNLGLIFFNFMQKKEKM